MGTLSFSRHGVSESVGSTWNIMGVGIKISQSLEAEFLFLEAILVRIPVELQSNQLDDKLLNAIYDRAEEQSK